MSEWLQQLGKKSLTSASDISDTNYEEFERLEYDGVKQINEANDEFAKTVEEQAKANISFHNAYYANKFSQYQSLAELTQTGAQVAQKGLQMNEVRKFYDEGYKHYHSEEGIAGDKYVQDLTEQETALHNATKEALIITNKDIIKKNYTIFERSLLQTSGEQVNVLVQDKDDAYKIGETILPAHYESAFNIPVLLKREGGKSVMLSYNDAVTVEDKAEILDIINYMFLYDIRQKTDYSDGFIRKYVTGPMYKKREILLNEAATALGKAKGVETAKVFNKDFYQTIIESRTSGGDSTIIADQISQVYQEGDGELTWLQARTNTVGKIKSGIASYDLNKEDIIWIGKEEIMPHGKTDPKHRQMFRDMFPKEYQSLITAVNTRDSADADNQERGLQAGKKKIVNTMLEAVQAKGVKGATQDIKDAEEKWKTSYGDSIPIDPQILKYKNQIENPVNQDALRSDLEYRQRWSIPIPEDLYTQLLDPAELAKWKAIAATIPPVGWEQRAEDIGWSEHFKKNNRSGNKVSATELGALYRYSKDSFMKGYTASMSASAGTTVPLSQRRKDAIAAGNLAVETEIKALLDENPGYFIDVDKPTDEFIQIKTAKKQYINGLVEGDITTGAITSNELLFPDEKILLLRGQQYLNGELGKYAPSEWQQIAKYTNINAHDLITARLEALGMLPPGVKPTYSNESGSIYSMQDGTNYRMILRAKNGENIHVEFAEVLDKSRVNSKKGGYNFLQSKGEDLKTEKPLEKMTVLELATLAQENNYSKDFKIGMYNISGSDLRLILQDLQRHDPSETFLYRKFDQDLQDELIFLLYRSRLNQTKTLQGATAQTWAQTFNIPLPLAQELMDIYPFLKDTPYLQLQHLIPDAIPVLQEALAGQN